MLPFLKTPDWNEDGADWPHREASRFVDAGTYRWHVQRMGEGPTLLLLHGTGASTHSFAALMRRLAKRFDVIAVDLPGHGFTRFKIWAPTSLSHVAHQLGKLLGVLGVDPDVVVGHSAGAAIAIRMAGDGTIAPRAVVSINGALTPFPGAAGVMFPVMAKILYYNPFAAYAFAHSARDIERVERLIAQTGSDIPDENIEQYARLMRFPGHIAGALGMMAHWDLSGMPSALSRFEAPALFLAGERDKAVPPKTAAEAAAMSPEGREAVLPQLGHLMHEESPDEIADLIEKLASDADII